MMGGSGDGIGEIGRSWRMISLQTSRDFGEEFDMKLLTDRLPQLLTELVMHLLAKLSAQLLQILPHLLPEFVLELKSQLCAE